MRFLRSVFVVTICCATSFALPLPEEDAREKSAKIPSKIPPDLPDTKSVIGVTTAGVTGAAALMAGSGPLYEKWREKQWTSQDRKRGKWIDNCARIQIHRSPWLLGHELLTWCWEEYEKRKALEPSKDVPPLDQVSDGEWQKKLWAEDCAHKMFRLDPWKTLPEHRTYCMMEYERRLAELPNRRVAPLEPSSDAELQRRFNTEVCAQERFKANPSITLKEHRAACMKEYARWKAANPNEAAPSPISLSGADPQPETNKDVDDSGGQRDGFNLHSTMDKIKTLPSSLSWMTAAVLKSIVQKTKKLDVLNLQVLPSPPRMMRPPRMLLVP